MWGRGSKSVSLQPFRGGEAKQAIGGGTDRRIGCTARRRRRHAPRDRLTRCPKPTHLKRRRRRASFDPGETLDRAEGKAHLHSRHFMAGSCRRVRRLCPKHSNSSHFTIMGRKVALRTSLPAPRLHCRMGSNLAHRLPPDVVCRQTQGRCATEEVQARQSLSGDLHVQRGSRRLSLRVDRQATYGRRRTHHGCDVPATRHRSTCIGEYEKLRVRRARRIAVN